MRCLLPGFLILSLLVVASPSASAQAVRPAPPHPALCQVLTEAAVAAECRALVTGHTLMPQVVSVCGRLSPGELSVKCLHAAVDRHYAADAIDWCSRRGSGEDIVQCFTLTGGSNRVAEPVRAEVPAYPVPVAVPPAPAQSATVATPGVTEVQRKPLPVLASPRGPRPEVMQPPANRPPPSTLDRVGKDVRNAVESPGGNWLERVGHDVRGGAETVGEALRPRPTNDPAYGPGNPAPAR